MKATINATQISKELTKCKINPNGITTKDKFDRMLVDVRNMKFYVLRTQELASQMRLIMESESTQSDVIYKMAQDIIKLMAIFCAYMVFCKGKPTEPAQPNQG